MGSNIIGNLNCDLLALNPNNETKPLTNSESRTNTLN